MHTTTAIEQAIRAAYLTLTAHGQWLMLSDLRDALGERHSRWAIDAELIRLATAENGDVHLIPESNQKILTRAERDAAVSMGNQDKHLIMIER